MKQFRVFLLVACLALGQSLFAREKLAVLPIGGTGVDASTRQTVSQLLLSEMRQQNTYDIISTALVDSLLGDEVCSEPSCAISLGMRANADKVVVGNLNRLGGKIIFQYFLVDVSSGSTIVSDDMGALQVEDLDQVSKRVALSVCQQVPADKTVEVGLVTEQETLDVRSRKANATWGIGFGYLYPSNGYDDIDRAFVWDFRSLYEMRHFTVDAVLGFRKGFAMNVGVLYLMSLKDYSPFLGAGFGFHAVSHDYPEYSYDQTTGMSTKNPKKKKDGFEIALKAGLLTFRTYDFRLIGTVEYDITLNDFDDRSVVLTISVMRAGKRVFGIF